MKRKTFLKTLMSVVASTALPVAIAQPKAPVTIRVGYGPASDAAALFLAKDQGFFSKRGINAELTLAASSPAATAAVMSGSIDVMLTGVISVLQAVDADLPFTIVSGALVTPMASNICIMVRPESKIASAKDLIGKKIAVPGLGTAMDILSKRWLKSQGVDPSKVNYVEANLTQASDLLKSGQIDATVMADPQYARLMREKTGTKLVMLYDTAPKGVMISAYSATRKWATANAAILPGFRAALDEGAAFVRDNEAVARAAIASHLKVSPELVADMPIANVTSAVQPQNLQWLHDVMKEQDLFQTKINLQALVSP